jgi:hypothetical protein
MPVSIPSLGISIDRFTAADKRAVETQLSKLLARPEAVMSNKTAILKAFELGMMRAPGVNPSDLWHHIVYRHYLRIISIARPRIADGGQSWRRASGDAFQIFVQDYYNPRLAKHGISLRSLSGAADERATLSRMGLVGAFRPAKIDLIAERGSNIIGVLFLKASVAERIMGDSDASSHIMNTGRFTAFVTLDVKSYPPRNYTNRGEFGTPAKPSDKRLIVEQSGRYHLCVSYNSRTAPSIPPTSSGRLIVVPKLGQRRADPLELELRQRH